LDKIAEKKAPICVGIDRFSRMIPDAVAGPADDATPTIPRAASTHLRFHHARAQDRGPARACVKFQSAYFEKYLWKASRPTTASFRRPPN